MQRSYSYDIYPYFRNIWQIVWMHAMYCAASCSTIYVTEQKTAMFACKLKFQLIATLTMHIHDHCLCWLMSTGLLFHSAFFSPYKFMTGMVKWCQWRALICSSVDLIWLPLSVHVSVSRPCSGTMALVGTCGCHSHSKLYHLCCLAIASLF